MAVGVSMSGLASAVANEGGVGVISATGLSLLYPKLSPSYEEAGNLGLIEEIRKAREKTKSKIGVNVMEVLSKFCGISENLHCRKGEYFILWCRALAEFTLLSYRKEYHGAGADCLFCPCGEVDLPEVGGRYQYLSAAIVIEGPEAGGHLRYKESQLKDEAWRYCLNK